MLSVLRAACRDNSKVALASRVVGPKVSGTGCTDHRHVTLTVESTKLHTMAAVQHPQHVALTCSCQQIGRQCIPHKAGPAHVRHATTTAEQHTQQRSPCLGVVQHCTNSCHGARTRMLSVCRWHGVWQAGAGPFW
jgi:hypothetical protein